MNNKLFPAVLLSLTTLAAPLTLAGDGDGAALYQHYCAQCHGLEGDGFGVNSYDMDVAPRDHTDFDEMNARTDEELFKTIKFGGKSVNKSILMPNWDGNLSDEQIQQLVGYLRELCCQEE